MSGQTSSICETLHRSSLVGVLRICALLAALLCLAYLPLRTTAAQQWMSSHPFVAVSLVMPIGVAILASVALVLAVALHLAACSRLDRRRKLYWWVFLVLGLSLTAAIYFWAIWAREQSHPAERPLAEG